MAMSRANLPKEMLPPSVKSPLLAAKRPNKVPVQTQMPQPASGVPQSNLPYRKGGKVGKRGK